MIIGQNWVHGHHDFKETGKVIILPETSNIASQNKFSILLARKKEGIRTWKAINKDCHTNLFIS